MKAIVLFCMVVLAIAPTTAANAAPGAGCSQILQNLNDAAAAIKGDAASYWAHRARFVDYVFGQSSQTVPNAPQVAEQEKSQADAVKGGVPGRLASFRGLSTAAQAQDCLSPAQLSAIVEPTIKQAKRVNFDQFPLEESTQGSLDQTPTRMPNK